MGVFSDHSRDGRQQIPLELYAIMVQRAYKDRMGLAQRKLGDTRAYDAADQKAKALRALSDARTLCINLSQIPFVEPYLDKSQIEAVRQLGEAIGVVRRELGIRQGS